MEGKTTRSVAGSCKRLAAACRAATLVLLLALLPLPAFSAATKADAAALLAQGRQLYQQEDFLGSRAPFEQALAVYRDLDDTARIGEAALALGSLLVDLGEYKKALGLYSESLAIWRRLGDREKEAETLRKLGELAAIWAQYRNAADFYEQALSIWKGRGKEKEQAQVLEALRDVAFELGHYSAAIEHGEAALAIWRKLGLEKEQTDSLGCLGWVAREADRYADSNQYYREALALSRKLGDERGQAYSLQGLGDTSAMITCRGPSEEADSYRRDSLPHFDNALAAARAAGHRKEEAGLLGDRGWAALALGQREAALDAFRQSSAKYREVGLVREAADALLSVAWETMQPEEGKRAAQEALAIYRTLGLRRGEAGGLSALGAQVTWSAEALTELMSGKSRQATIAAARASLTSQGIDLQGYETGVGYLEQALEIERRLELRPDAVGTLLMLSAAMWLEGEVFALPPQYDRYESYTKQGITLCQSIGRGHWASHLLGLGLGELARTRGEYGKAEDYFQQAIAFAQAVGTVTEVADATEGLAEMWRGLGQYEKAAGYAMQAKGVRERLREGAVRSKEVWEGAIAEDSALLARIADDAGDYEAAARNDAEALATFDKTSPADAEVVRLHLAQVYLNQGKLPEAKELLARLKERAGPADWGRYHLLNQEYQQALEEFTQAKILTGVGLAEEGLHHWDRAAQAYTQAVEATEKVRAGTPLAQRGRFFEGKDNGFRRLEPYEGLVRVLHRMGREEDAFYRSEYTRARMLVEGVARAPYGASLGLPEDLRKQEDGLATVIASLTKQHDANPDDAQLAVQLQLKRDEQAQLVEKLRQEYPEYALIQYPQPVRVSELVLGPQEVLLVYKVTEPATFAFLVRRGKVAEVFEIPLTRSQLDALLLKYRTGFASVREARDLRALDVETGQKLYQLLLAPALAKVAPDEQVVVVPDEMLELLPLEALVVESPPQVTWQEGRHGPYPEGARFVGESRVFTYWQSGTTMTITRRLPKPASGDKVLVIADPIYQSEATPAAARPEPQQGVVLRAEERTFGQLAKASAIVTALWPLYGDRLRSLVGSEASEATLKREPLGDYQAVIFATHGVLEAPKVGQPALVLSQVDAERGEDGYLTMTEVMQLKLQAEVVALMACSTGTGRLVGGEGIMALGRAFQYAGGRSVLSSLWEAEDLSTNLLTQVFMEQLAQGQDKAAALQTARRRVREAGYLHPFYWANFVLIGEQGVAKPAN